MPVSHTFLFTYLLFKIKFKALPHAPFLDGEATKLKVQDLCKVLTNSKITNWDFKSDLRYHTRIYSLFHSMYLEELSVVV